MSPFMLLVLLVVVVIAFVVVIYNKMIKMRNHADEAWSDIDVQLKRRYNLIPNLVETVKGYAAHEEGVFTKVTEARSNAINAGNMKEQAQAENMLSGALKSLFAVAENYPDLKANENFMQLQTELVDTEDKIQAARRFYNGTVRDFNTKLQQFPNSMIAKMFKFEDKEFFEIEGEEEKEVVEVSFDKDKPQSEKSESGEATEGSTSGEAAAEAPAEAAVAEEPKSEEPTPEAPTEAEKPTEPEAPAEPAKCPKCGGEMTEGHTCPEPEAEEKKEEEEKPAEEATPAEPAKCPKCGGEMTEGHVCPMPEKTEEEKPAEEAPAEEKTEEAPIPAGLKEPGAEPEEKPAEAETPAPEETPKEEPPTEATEAPAAEEGKDEKEKA